MGIPTLVGVGLWAFAFDASALDSPAAPDVGEDLTQLSLEELANVQVTSVSKKPESLAQAPAAIYVITHDEIMRSGVTTLSEALRLAPNLSLTRLGATNYTGTARGFGGNQADQAFPNKLLILLDGRSVYTPLYSGIYLDAQDVVLEDVDRIEVISGSGATLWGANAVNGVINVITRPAYLTGGGLLSTGAGNQEQILNARYGGKINDETAYRIYTKELNTQAEQLPDRSSAHDGAFKAQGGFRMDLSLANDTVTAQGDVYRGTEQQLDLGDLLIEGANALARWQHRTDRSQLQLQAYYDQTERSAPLGGAAFVLHTYDVELQQTIAVGSMQQVVWGAGERINSYSITNTATLLFEPEARNLTLSNLFTQDTVALTRAVKLTLGVKFEDDPYSGWSVLPDARLSWQLSDRALLWTASSRAIRSPTPFDVDVVEKAGDEVFLTGKSQFRPERVSAYEIGYRGQPAGELSVSLSGFYNVYDDLRTVEPASSTVFLPLRWDNFMVGRTYGVEAWADWQITSWWRLSPSVRTLHKDLHFKTGASGLLGLAQAGDDPSSQASIKSSLELGPRVSFDAILRYVAALPEPALKAYTELTAHLAWQVSPTLQLSLSGFNLLHARHYEYPAPAGEQIIRSGLAQARWTF
jgi:iron complex outermembrane receptor protein